jgi:hypothetical protein
MIIWFEAVQWDELSGEQPLYRGFSKKIEGVSVQISSPENRSPVSMPLGIQTEMDNWFENRFGMRFRQRSLFATGSLEAATHYAADHGEVRVLRPIAPFCFCWSEQCADLYEEYENMPRDESIPELLQRLEFKCVDLDQALQSSHEIMLIGTTFQADLINKF